MASRTRTALITGSSRGIGRGIALKLAGQKVKVATNYVSNEAAAKDPLAKVREKGSDGIVVQADVCQPKEIERMFAKIKSEFATWTFSSAMRAPKCLPSTAAPWTLAWSSGIRP